MNKKRLLVICPGRGTYGKDELGSIAELITPENESIIKEFERSRSKRGFVSLKELDGASGFSPSAHLSGENASALIHLASYLEFLSIDQNKYEISALTGNSMGWYLALCFSHSLNLINGIDLVQTMGSMPAMSSQGLIGKQAVYRVVDEQWNRAVDREEMLKFALQKAQSQLPNQCHVSIEYGGFAVLGCTAEALNLIKPELEELIELPGNAAFHTPLLEDYSRIAFEKLPLEYFEKPKVPIIDGDGQIWHPFSTDTNALHEYTLEKQVLDTYSFSKAVEVGLKEFAPDHILALGPSTKMAGAIGQIIVNLGWRSIRSKDEFFSSQRDDPFLLLKSSSLEGAIG